MEAKPGVFNRKPTPEQPQGPFYPLTKPAGAGNDLTAVPGKPNKAQGQVIQITGRVLDTNGKPVSGAQIEIWQANTFGRYTHPQDSNPAPLDPGFAGYGVFLTGNDGRYTFKTVKPGAYRISAQAQRTRHIHFSLTSAATRLITQMYFDGEPLNSVDSILSGTADKEDLLVSLAALPGDKTGKVLGGTWDIVLWQS